MKRLTVFTLLSILTIGLFTATAAYASHFWKVDLSQPFSTNNGISNQRSFNLEYKVLSTSESSSDTYSVSVRQDGSEIATDTIPTGGDSSATRITVSSDGTYNYSIVVTSNLHPETKTAGPVTVHIDTNPPAAADYGQKSQSGNQHTVTFTVTDPDAELVNIYSSTSTTFTANEATKVGEVTPTGSQQSFTYTAGTGERYHAVQVVDDAGNVSPLVGDPGATVTFQQPVSTASTTTGGSGGNGVVIGENGQVINENGEVISEDGETLGAQDEDGEAGENEDQQGTEDGETLAAADTADDDSNLAWYVILAIIVAGIGYYLWRRRSLNNIR